MRDKLGGEVVKIPIGRSNMRWLEDANARDDALRNFVRRLDLGTLDLFVLIAEGGSIAAAARQGGLAASAVSKRIAELEAAAGAPLLVRHARGVRPTPAGERLLRPPRPSVGGGAPARRSAGMRAGVRGRVRVAASASAVEQFLPGEIAAFRRRHPDIRIDLIQGTSRAVAERVRAREADIGICNPTEGNADLMARSYRVERLVLVTPPGHPLAARSGIAFAETLDFEQIGLRGSSSVQETLSRAARRSRRALRQGIEVDGLSAMCRMIENGLGVGVMPDGAFRALGAASGLAAVALSDAWAVRALNLYAPDFAELSPSALRFADHLTAGSAAAREALVPVAGFEPATP
jgi:DNA-binding transcriptional LysR family regulator